MTDNFFDLTRLEAIDRLGIGLTNALADIMCTYAVKKIGTTADLAELDNHFKNLNARFPTVDIRYLSRATGATCAFPWQVTEVSVSRQLECITLKGDTGEWFLRTKTP